MSVTAAKTQAPKNGTDKLTRKQYERKGVKDYGKTRNAFCQYFVY